MTDRQPNPASAARRRPGRRGIIAVTLSATVLGGGAAYAAYDQFYEGGAADGLTCMTEWNGSSTGFEASSGGPALTADPVADCQHYQELNGGSPIVDPVAFHLNNMLFVAPRSQVPPSADPLEVPTAQDSAQFELDSGLTDWVDGLVSRCYTSQEATTFVEGELERLGMESWQIESDPSAGPGFPCAGASLDAGRHTVVVSAHGQPDLAEANGGTVHFVYVLRDALRDKVATRCLGLADAKAIAEQALGSEHHWPLTAIPDESATCTRVDLEVGGSVLVTLRGPETPSP